MTVLWVLIAIVVVGFGYIRLAPSDPARWHKPPEVSADKDLPHGVKRIVETGPNGLGQLDAIIRQTPRTRVLAGSVEEGMITYVTRTKVIGFPDYTTVQAEGERLKIYGRLRFGRSDLGVNRNRVDGWLAALKRVSDGG
ncbi:DUF1499 domain-containing protein [Aestuariivita boseongensis]|uniref:DUF1499 domain-containing protein n=1 Tax=Aestuariivita boseongensis TaxID=1470562 RepID=UPI001FE20F7F|nr:DUF1499 domain-containing protein [Aestuariivita boseongensis]